MFHLGSGFQALKLSLGPGSEPSPLEEPSGKAWMGGQERAKFFSACVSVNRCDGRSRSSCGCSDPNWLHPFIIRKHWGLAAFHQLNGGEGGKNPEFPGTQGQHCTCQLCQGCQGAVKCQGKRETERRWQKWHPLLEESKNGYPL